MNNTARNFTLAALLAAATALQASPRYSCDLTFSGYAGSAQLTNFPVLVRLAENSPVGFSYSQLATDASDLSFADASANMIPCEVETWNPSGESCVWVRVPALTSATTIRMRWGDPEVTTPSAAQAKGAVWAPADYAGVWHFAEEDGTAYDSTTNALDATADGTATGEMVISTNAAAGFARTISSTGKSNYFTVPNYNSLGLGGSFTVGGWFKAMAIVNNGRVFCRKKSYTDANGWEIQWNSSSASAPTATPRGASASSNGGAKTLGVSLMAGWAHLVWVFDGTSAKTYANGALVGENTIAEATDNGRVLTFMSAAAYTGAIDEFRLQDGAASADWIQAEYDTVAKASFYTAGITLDSAAIGHFLVEASAGETGFQVSPAFGAQEISAGQVIAFSAPEEEFRLEDGRYLSYQGYSLYVIDAVGNVSLAAESDSLSGTYTHTYAGAKLVWKQFFRRGGATFPTSHASVVTVIGYTGEERQRLFPVVLRIAEGNPEGFSYADVQEGGADILFTTQAGAVIPHEIETWDTNGTSAIWVNLPEMALGTKFLFRYGNATVTTPRNNPADVWADAGYAGVWHMAETNAADNAADSTGHGLHAVPGGADASEMIGNAAGAAGGARVVASSAVVNSFSVPNYDFLNLGGSFTIGGWFKATTITSNGRVFCRKKSYTDANGWEIQWNSGSASAPTASARGSSSASNQRSLGVSLSSGWAYLAWVFDGATATTYANGSVVGQPAAIAAATDNGRALSFPGTYTYKGSLDEVRLLRGPESASRLFADYQAVSDPDFLSAAAVSVSTGADFLTVGSFGGELGEPVPAYGTHTGLTNGQVVAFSAPAGELVASEDLHYRFAGWSLTVTDGEGNEGLPQNSAALSGTYTHAAGASARLVWNIENLHAVRTSANHGSVSGAGYFPMGASVTLTATPASGYRLWDWKVNGETTGRLAESLTVLVGGVMEVEAVFTPVPATIGLWTLTDRRPGEELSTLTNEVAAPFTGVGTAVAATPDAGTLPVCADEHPSLVIFADGTATSVLARNPKSIRFAPAEGFTTAQGGGDILFAELSSLIAATNDVMIECFAKADTTDIYKALLSANLGNDAHCVFLPGDTASSTRLSCENATAGNKGWVSRSLPGTATEAWHHIALIYKPSEQKARFFVNYVEASSAKAVSILGANEWSGHNLHVGSALGNGRSTQNFAGHVCCLRVTLGERDVTEFMVAAPFDPSSDDTTVALFNPRGPNGEPATTFRSLVGDRRLAAVCVNPAGEITWTNDAPGEVVFASAADREAKKVLLRRPGSLHFANPNSVSSYIVMENLSQILADMGDFTVEFFARCEATNNWKSAFAANLDKSTVTVIQVPGSGMTEITLQTPGTYACNMGYNMSGGGRWHHIALVYSKGGSNMGFYIDYTRRVGLEFFTKAHSACPAILGAGYNKSSFFIGEIAALRVTRRALAADEFLVAGPNPVRPLKIFVQ